jgi:hypothetical protein
VANNFIFTAVAKFCLNRQKFALIGTHFADSGKVPVKIAIYFASIGKNLPRSASVLRKSANRMGKPATSLASIGKNLPSLAKFCLNRHPVCGNRQKACRNRHLFCGDRQKIASIGIRFAEIGKQDGEMTTAGVEMVTAVSKDREQLRKISPDPRSLTSESCFFQYSSFIVHHSILFNHSSFQISP